MTMATTGVTPRIGDLVRLDAAASSQFERPIWFRVIGVRPSPTVPGWVYLDGWELAEGLEITEVTVFVRVAGLTVRRDD
ncbi:hypothetical protein [Actinocatenispora comari]|jgi:hypothetical protein|uniref:Uncharacterized protein n=1 Tax=Actinocatenispora comari TaxID=2807577 RepID=A0A8J4EM64_9ACTN|nr:hypothetical protein [Actinocatenispora comari]GIL26289.1 hypothetical protein NUM_15430 [Actinocatenispora comari]